MRLKRYWLMGLSLLMAWAVWGVTPKTVAAAALANGIVHPAAESTISGVVSIEGVAHHAGFRKWQLDILVDGDEQQARFIAVGEEMQPLAAQLSELDTTHYPDGEHLLRLRVVYTGLNYDEFYTPVIINNGNPALATGQAESSDDSPIPALNIAPEIIEWENGVLGANVPDGERWIEVDISDQMLTAWQGDTIVLKTQVSTGKPGWRTLPGTFYVYVKYDETRMRGPDYDTPDVPWTMYYYQGFAIHGAYWHNNFGTPVSHGCVNLRVDEAKLLYDWASVGTKVVVNQ